jgi:hypothetical protein
MTIINTLDNQHKKRKGLFWLPILLVSAHDQLALFEGTLSKIAQSRSRKINFNWKTICPLLKLSL